MTKSFDFDELVRAWPSALVARREVARFSGGILQPRTMANLDSLGQGPQRIRIGKQTAYPAQELADWMHGRAIQDQRARENARACK